jgi:serine protease Do
VLGIATSGTVIGLSHNHDLALVRTASPIPGHIFDVATTAPAIGTEMAAIGFQLRRAMQLSVGHITGTHDHRQVGNSNWAAALSDVVLADAAVNPGNSGGPWITMAGLVVALDESGPPYDGGQRAQGNNGGVSAADAATTFAAWEQDPQTVPTGSCTLESPVDAANQTLFDYLGDITDSDYASAYAQVNPAGHPISGLDNFISGVGSSTDQATDGSGNLYQVTGTGQSDGQPYIDATFQSMQDAAHGPGGETCTVWTLRYTFSAVNGLELIDKALTTPGTAGHVAC